jgi:predicted amidophosphoribosyltransferase
MPIVKCEVCDREFDTETEAGWCPYCDKYKHDGRSEGDDADESVGSTEGQTTGQEADDGRKEHDGTPGSEEGSEPEPTPQTDSATGPSGQGRPGGAQGDPGTVNDSENDPQQMAGGSHGHPAGDATQQAGASSHVTTGGDGQSVAQPGADNDPPRPSDTDSDSGAQPDADEGTEETVDRCPYVDCRAEVADPNATYCMACGKPLDGSADAETVDDGRDCPSCGGVVDANAEFCPDCGTNLTDPADDPSALTCPNCDRPVDEGDDFCSGCGQTLQDESDAPNSSESVCPSCGSTIDPDASFCSDCGAELMPTDTADTADPACFNCGETVSPDDDFCPNCGADLTETNDTEEFEASSGVTRIMPDELVLNFGSETFEITEGEPFGAELREIALNHGATRDQAKLIHRQHAHVVRRDNGLYLHHDGENPLQVNGETVPENGAVEVEPGDVINLGNAIEATLEGR